MSYGEKSPPVAPWIIDDLARSGLTPETFPVTPLKSEGELMRRLGFSKISDISIIEMGGYWIEYPNTEGFYRLKLKEPIVGAKYLSPKGAGNHAYIPLAVSEVARGYKPDIPLYLVEGEKKAACATKNGYSTIGLPGVFGFTDSEHEPLPELNELILKHRKCYIVFDSDIREKTLVQIAELRLAALIVNKGGIPLSLRLPNDK